MRTHDGLAGLDHVWVRLALQLVGYEEQQKAPLEQVDAEELGEWLAWSRVN